MTTVRPLGAGDPDPLDFDASEQLERNEAGRLQLVRTRAEKWIGGISALAGALGTVLVLKGRDTVTEVTVEARIAAAVVLALALGLLAYGIYRAYHAAFGAPGALAEIDLIPLTGLHDRLIRARHHAATTALRDLAAAVQSVFVAIALVAVGVGITWFAPTETPTATDKTICVFSDDRLVARLAGDSAAIKESMAGSTVGPCP